MRSFLLVSGLCCAVLLAGCRQEQEGIKDADGSLANQVAPSFYASHCYPVAYNSADFARFCEGKQIVWDATVETAAPGNYNSSPNGLIRANVHDAGLDRAITVDLVIGKPAINPRHYPEGTRVRFVGVMAGHASGFLEIHDARILKIYRGAEAADPEPPMN